MINNRKYPSPLWLAVFAFLATTIVAKADVYQWTGGSGLWTDTQHWMVDGQSAHSIPGIDDDVFISSDSDLEIEINSPAHVASITTTGTGQVQLTSHQNATVKVGGSLILSPNAQIDGNLTVELLGTATHTFLQADVQAQSHIIETGGNYDDLAAGGGSCPFFTIVPNPTAPTCNGSNDGIAEVLEPTDGVGPYTYQWIGGPDAPQWPGVGAGTYTVIVIDVGQGGLPCNIDVFVNEPGPLTVFDMNANPPLCADVCNGTATPIIIGGNGGYSYTWSSGETGIIANQLCPVFNLVVEDQLGCILDTTYTFPNPPDTIKFEPVITNVDCFGNDNGAIDMTITGGIPPFDVNWTGPNGFASTSEDISNLEPGDYFISVSDDNACLADSMFTIAENPVLDATAVVVDNDCGGGMLGEIDLTPTGGLPPYSYAWTGPDGFTSSDEDLTGLASGLYQVTITDDALCTFDLDATVDEPVAVTIDFTPTNLNCFEDFTGQVTASAQGGSPGYTYDWTGPNGFVANGPAINGLEAGWYYATATDANTCATLDSIEITQPDLLEITLTETPITCHNGADGSIELEISGGTPAYTVAWTGPNGFVSGDEDISNLEPGQYNVTVTDANDCIVSGSLELSNPDDFDVTADLVQSTCTGSDNGSIDLTVNGGTAPYDYSWTGPNGFTSTNEDITGLEPGVYNVDITDANNCATSASFDLQAPADLQVNFDVTDILCFGTNTGEILVTPIGGQAPYNFIWIGPNGFVSTDQNLTDLFAGNYELLITDANFCNGVFPVTVNQEPELIVVETQVDVSCFGFTDGSLTLNVSGANPPYDFAWTGPNGFTSTLQDISNLEAGVYDLVVTDALDCDVLFSFEILQPDEITVDEIVTDVLCAGDANGSIALTIAGGVLPYDIDWTGPNGFTSTDQDIVNLEGGTYDLVLTDANNCVFNASYVVGETFFLGDVIVIQDVSCFGATDGALTLTVVGGTEPYDISWTGPNGFVGTGAALTNLESGLYTATIQDANGCTLVRDYLVDTPVELFANVTHTDITCFGENDGTATANPSGGSAPYSVSWVGPNGFTSNNLAINNLEPGTYTVTVEDAGTCTVSESIDVLEPTLLTLDVDVVQPSCSTDDGSLTAIVGGGTVAADYSYSWLDGTNTEISTNAAITNLAPDTYTIVVSDDNGCTEQAEIELTRDSFTLVESIFDVTCIGAVDGAIDVTTDGGTDPFTFDWTGPNGFTSNDQNISGLEAGTYDVHVEDAAGCIFDASYEINEPEALSFASVVEDESCPGNSDGSIALTVSGGTPGYLVNWTGPNGFVGNGLNISNLEPGTYTATATDIQGCANNVDIEVGVGAEFTVDGQVTPPNCLGTADGSIDLTLTEIVGVSTPFDFNWTGPNGFTSTDEDINGLEAGTYTVIITGATGCVLIEAYDLIDPLPITLTTSATNANCNQADGSAEVVAAGGTEVFTYSWTDVDGTEVSDTDELNNVFAGTYTINVTDENGCSANDVVVISDQNGTVSGIVVNPTCNQGSDGSIDITVTDGTEPYTFEWTDGTIVISDQEDLVDVPLGNYFVTVTDANGCLYLADFEITEPQPITGTPTITPVSCLGNDGAVTLFAENGLAPYTIDWSGPGGFVSAGVTITDLEEGTYNYTITDANNCVGIGSVEVGLIPDIVANVTQTDVLCGGESTGELALDVSGGTAPYTFDWTGPDGFVSGDEDLTGLSAGIYDLTITDLLGCSIEFQFEIIENTPITADFNIVHPDCNMSNGSISAVVSGGVVNADYFINWTADNGNPLPQELNINNLDVGSYTLLVADDNGCAYDTTIVLSNPGANIVPTVYDLTCYTETEGGIELVVSGVQAPYDVEWIGPNGFTSTSQNIFSLEAGLYTYTITGQDGCVFIETIEVGSPDIISATAVVNGTCFGDNNGSISVVVSGGVEPYSIGWIGPDGFASAETEISDLEPGTYMLQIVDANSCLEQITYDVLENPELTLSETITHVACFGTNTGSISIEAAGGTAPYTFEWVGPSGFVSSDQNLIDIGAGTYSLTFTDGVGCTIVSEYEITEEVELSASIVVTPVGCASPESLGAIDLEITGGTPDYHVTWSGPNGFGSTDQNINDLEAGNYTYQITDSNGCELTDQVEVQEVEPIEVTINASDITCNGEIDGSITLTVSGGTPGYTISWTGPNGFTSDELELTNLEAGTYQLNIIDELGCTANESVEIVEPPLLVVDNIVVVDATCNTLEDGSISVDITGGTVPYTISWTGPNGFESEDQNLANLAIGDYELAVTDANGCTASGSATIDTPFEVFADAGDDFTICEEVQPELVIGTGSNADEFYWSDGAGETLSNNATLEIDEEPGSFTFVLHASNDLCGNTDTLLVDVLESPEVDAGEDFEVFAEEEFVLGGDPTSPTAIEFAWSPDQGFGMDTTLANPFGYILETTEFTVVATDANGCQNTDSILVTLIPDLDVSSGFTPNGDGVNDTWIIDNMQLFPNSVVNVFDRWGIIVFEANAYNQSNAWDGTYKGDQLPVGTYYYTIELNDERFPEPFTGPITIYR